MILSARLYVVCVLRTLRRDAVTMGADLLATGVWAQMGLYTHTRYYLEYGNAIQSFLAQFLDVAFPCRDSILARAKGSLQLFPVHR
jgi:hypothetical protein